MWRYALIIVIVMGIIATGYGVWGWYDNQHTVRMSLATSIRAYLTRLP
jgi:uncharacterized membrane protein YidH (DUF202 family)